MSNISFDRPVGASVDVKELEYLSFLHQSGDNIKSDGSIRDEDVKAFLKSRYGIEVTLESVRNTVLQGLAGSSDENEVIDLMELTAILIIPVLVKAAAVVAASAKSNKPNDFRTLLQEEVRKSKNDVGESDRMGSSTSTTNIGKGEKSDKSIDLSNTTTDHHFIESLGYSKGTIMPPMNLIENACRIILHDTTGDVSSKPLTPEFLQKTFLLYGEHELAEDEALIAEMIKCASVAVREIGDDAIEGISSNVDVVHENETEIIFNSETFARCLTYDVQLYNVQNEDRHTVGVEDILPPPTTLCQCSCAKKSTITTEESSNVESSDAEKADHLTSNKSDNKNEEDSVIWKRTFTAPAIDITADTFRSKGLMVLIWTLGIATFGVMLLTTFTESDGESSSCGFEAGVNWKGNGGPMTCKIVNSIITWLFNFTIIAFAGLLFTGLSSIGNTMRCRSFLLPILGTFFFVTNVAMPDTISSYLVVMKYFIMALSGLGILMHLTHSAALLLPKRMAEGTSWLSYLLRAGILEAEHSRRRATSLKLNKMIENAMHLLSGVRKGGIHDSYYGYAMHQFSKVQSLKYESIGGVWWTWKRMFNGTLLSEEGICFSVRVLASNIGQGIVCILILVSAGMLTKHSLEAHDNGSDKVSIYNYTSYIFTLTIENPMILQSLDTVTYTFGILFMQLSDMGYLNTNCTSLNTTFVEWEQSNTDDVQPLCFLATEPELTLQDRVLILNITGLDINSIFSNVQNGFIEATQAVVEDLYPSERYMLSTPFYVFIIVAFFSAVGLTLSYIPYAATTIMKLRCGILPTLKGGNEAQSYRVAPDTVALLTGSLFWGCLASSILLGLVAGLIVFVVLWQETIWLVQILLAFVIGFLVVFLIKTIILLIMRRKYCAGFYRKNPAGVNIFILALEWANFPLTSGIIFVRMIITSIISFFSVGRIYRPLLAPGVGNLGPIELDGHPTIHIRELLAHEAHRHPYLELLGLIYLMKLKYKEEFGKAAGSTWRLLFLYAFMPWLQMHRIRTESDVTMKSSPSKLVTAAVDTTALHIEDLRDNSQQEVVEYNTDDGEESSLSTLEGLEKEIAILQDKIRQIKDKKKWKSIIPCN